ncbi:MAG: YdcF family protein [Oculatellaceae cyanobacterium bins.114]|nr:YdcF family protein [Oculatellaceae cyanobacterium bins.114]
MFLFLSKLLPLFIYPLGLACLFLLVTLITLWKRPRIAALSSIAALVVLLIGSNGWVAAQLVRSLEWQYLPTATLPNAEAIVVLGGGIKPQIAPRPWIDVAEAGDRTIYGAQLYQQGKAPLIVLSGGRIEWKGGGPPESEDMAKLVEALGVPKTAIAQDPNSLNTYENAVNVKQILQQRGINRVLLVTSAMHMPRSMGIFKKQGIEAIAAPTDFGITTQELNENQSTVQGFLLNLLPDAEKLQQTSRAIKEYVGILVYRLKGWM